MAFCGATQRKRLFQYRGVKIRLRVVWATSAAQITNGGTVGDPALAGVQNLMFATIALDTNSDAAV
jgi:hypothetical protein